MNSSLSLLMPSLKAPASTAAAGDPAAGGGDSALASLFAGVLQALDAAPPSAETEALREQVSDLLSALPEQLASASAAPAAVAEMVQAAEAAIAALQRPPAAGPATLLASDPMPREAVPAGESPLPASATAGQAPGQHPGQAPALPALPLPVAAAVTAGLRPPAAAQTATLASARTSPATPAMPAAPAALAAAPLAAVDSPPALETMPADLTQTQSQAQPQDLRPMALQPTHLALATALRSAQAAVTPAAVNDPALPVAGPTAVPLPLPEGLSSPAPVAASQPLAVTAPASATVTIPVPMQQTEAFGEAMGLHLTRLASQGVQQAQVHVSPEALGPISVRLVMQGQQLQVDFQARSAQTADLIEQMMPRLVMSLEAQGIRLDDARVQVMSAADAQSFAQQFGRQEGQGESARARQPMPAPPAASEAPAPPAEAPAPLRSTPPAGRIDYYA